MVLAELITAMHWHPSHIVRLTAAVRVQAMTDFRLLGVVLGLAIYNTVLLDFPLPIALYRKICDHNVGLMDLENFQPTVGKCAPRASTLCVYQMTSATTC